MSLSRTTQTTISSCHIERAPNGIPPMFMTLHDEASQQLSVILVDRIHVIVTIPWPVDQRRETVHSVEQRRKQIALDCLRELRHGERQVCTAELVYEQRRGTMPHPEEHRLPKGFRPAVHTMKPDVRTWPVRRKPWWRRSVLGEYGVLFAAGMLLVAVDCTLAVVSANANMLLCPLIVAAALIIHSVCMRWLSHSLYAVSLGLMAYRGGMALRSTVGFTRCFALMLLWHAVMTGVICCAGAMRKINIWKRHELPLAISVSHTDGCFRLHGSKVCGRHTWQYVMQLSHVHAFHALCHSPLLLNKAIGSYYVQVQRRNDDDNSYVHFGSKDITTYIVPMLSGALSRRRHLQATVTSYHTIAAPYVSVREALLQLAT